MLTWLRILWPSFLLAGLGGTAFFIFFDPTELTLFGERLPLAPTAV